MIYSLCISPSCPNCIHILTVLSRMDVELIIINVELQNQCPNPIVPALYKGKRLIAYGKDIIEYFDN